MYSDYVLNMCIHADCNKFKERYISNENIFHESDITLVIVTNLIDLQLVVMSGGYI